MTARPSLDELLASLQRVRDEAVAGPEWVPVPRFESSTCDSETFAAMTAVSVGG